MARFPAGRRCRLGLLLPLALALVSTTLRADVTETYRFEGLNRQIPDGNGSGLVERRNLESSITSISRVRVFLEIAGAYNGDLYAYLVHDRGLCILLNRPGLASGSPAAYPDSGMDVLLDDAAPNGDIHHYRETLIPAEGTPLGGAWQPDGRKVHPLLVGGDSPRTAALASFQTLPASGDWTLFVADLEQGAPHRLVAWGVEITGVAPLRIVWPAPEPILYGTPLGPAQLSATANVAGTFAYDPAPGVILNAAAEHRLTATFTPDDLVEYAVTNVSVLLQVDPAPLRISADAKTKPYGAPLPSLTATFEGLVAGDTPASLAQPLTLATRAEEESPPGAYPITLAGGTDPNYQTVRVEGVLTIERAPTTANLVASANPAPPGQPLVLTLSVASAAGGLGIPEGEAQFFANGSPMGEPVPLVAGVARQSGDQLGLGSYSITASYAGSAFFLPASAGLAGPLVINSLPVATSDIFPIGSADDLKMRWADLLTNDHDPDDDVISLEGIGPRSAAGGTVDVKGPWIQYRRPGGHRGNDSFTYVIADTRGGSDRGVVTLRAAGQPDTPARLTLIHEGPGTYRIRVEALPTQIYGILVSHSMAPNTWRTLTSVTTDGNGVAEWIDTTVPSQRTRFYRTTGGP